MKRKLLLSWGICFVLTASLFAQKPFKPTLKNAFDNVEVHELTRSEFTYSSERALCEDTIRYAEAKEAILGSGSFVGFGLWADDNEAITHTFLNSGSLTITGAEVLALKDEDSPVDPSMEVALYSVDGSYTPITQLASGVVTVSAQNYYYVNFSSPVVVTDNYALVIRTTNASSILVVGINDDEVNSYDEGLSKYRSSYYSSSSGNWISVSAFTEYVSEMGYAVDFEPIVSPIVSYNISPTADIDPLTACVGEEVTFTNTTNTGILSNRMYNYSAFRHHFGTAPTDSTFVRDLDNGAPFVWSVDATNTYTSPGQKEVLIGANDGFWNSCFDYNTYTVTVNDLDDATFSYPSNTLCLGGGAVVPTITGVSGGTFSVDNTDLEIDPTTGEIDIDASQEGVYVVTYTTNDICPNDESVTITVTSSPDASFTYDNTDYCSNEGTILPSFAPGASAGLFTSTTGLVFVDASTGEINLNASDAGVYTITNTIAASGSCPEISETFEITVNEAPTVTASADQTEVCAGEEVTLTATASAGTVSWDNGVTDGTPFIPTATTTYTVTADNNGCTETDEITITVNALPTVTASADQTEVCAGEEVTLTATASAGTVSWDNDVTNGDPFIPTATTTYTVTADNNGCTETDEITITVNELPTVTIDNGDIEACIYHDAIELIATPAGGTFSGPGVTNNSFDPQTAGNGTHTITYTYKDAEGCENSATIQIEVDGCVGISTNELNNQVVLYPNPSTNYIDVALLGNHEMASVVVISLEGKVVNTPTKTVDNQTTRIDVSSLSVGTYLVQISTNNGTITKKIMVQ